MRAAAPSPQLSEPTSDRRRVIIATIAFLAIQAAVSVAATAVPVLAPVAARDLAVSAALVGAFSGIVYGVAMVTGLVGAAFAARIGAIRTSQIALLAAAFGLWLASLGTLPHVIAAAVIIGVGYGPVTPASSHSLARLAPPGLRSLVFSVKQTGVPAGAATAGLAVPALLLATDDWGEALVVLAGGICVIAALLLPLRRMIDGQGSDGQTHAALRARSLIVEPLALVAGDARLRRLALLSFCFAGLQVVLSSVLVTFLTETQGFTLAAAGLALSLSQVAGVAGRILWGAAADRVGAPLVLIVLGIGMTVGAATFTAMDLSAAPWPVLAVKLAAVAMGATASGWNGVFLAEVARLAPAGAAAKVTGGALFATYGGVMAIPPGFSLIVALTQSYAAAFAVAGLLVLLPTLALVAAQIRRDPAPPAA